MKINKLTYLLLLLIISFHLLFLFKLVFWPYAELFIYSYLTEIGSIPYKQIFDQHFPGVMFFPVNLYSLGIDTPQEARWLHLGLVSIVHILIFFIARKIFKSEKYALFCNFIYMLTQPFYEGYALWIESFIIPLLLLSFYYLYKWRENSLKIYILLSGFFIGLVLLFKQPVLPLIFFVIVYIYLRKRQKDLKSVSFYIATVFIAVVPIIIYIIELDILKEFWYWTVWFNLTTFNKMGRTYPDILGLVKVFPVYIAPFLLGIYTYLIKKDEAVLLLLMFYTGTLFFAFARFDLIHLQPVLPFSILLAVRSVKVLNRYKMLAFILMSLIGIFIMTNTFTHFKGTRVYFFGETEKTIADKVLLYANEGDTIYTLGTTPHIYYLTKTKPPDGIFVFQFPWFMIEAEDMVLEGIVSDPPKVVLKDTSSTVAGKNLVSYMEKIENYINKEYQVVDKIGVTEIMIQK